MKNRIRELRSQRDWSQRELAERLGVSRQTINALEAGRWDPSLKLALAVAKAFESSIEAIFDADDPAVSRTSSDSAARHGPRR